MFLVVAAAAFAETAQIAGTVTDPSGSAIPGASIAVTNPQTGVRRTVSTNQEGNYTVPLLQPGSYDVIVQKEGFKPVSRREMKLQVDDRVTLDFRLEVGAQNETVTVEAETPPLRFQDAQAGDVITSQMITNLPQINRNPLDLLRLSGDISGSGKANTVGNRDSALSDTRVNGGRTSGLEYLVDGQTIMSGKGHNVPASAIPTMESVEEFKVISNGISAEYGRASGGLVEVVTKGGTNKLHGQLFEYFHNQLLNANAWDQNNKATYVPGKKAERTQFHQNDWGFQVGGPVYLPKLYNGKNKTFFLFNYEGFKYRQAGVLNGTMAPTDAERNGDLTGLLCYGGSPMMWDPLGDIVQTADGYKKMTPMGGDGQHIPASRISDFAKTVLSYIPAQNHTPTPGWTQQNAYVAASAQMTDRYNWNARVDQMAGDKHHLYFRFSHDVMTDATTQWRSALDPAAGNHRPGSLEPSMSWDWTASPTLVVSARASLMHHPNSSGALFQTSIDSWNIDPLWKTLSGGLPNYNIRVWSAQDEGWGSSLGRGWGNFPSMDNYTNASASASITKISGRHTFKFGGEIRRYYDNHWEDLEGTWNFQGADLGQESWNLPSPYTSLGATGAWGEFLLGRMDYGSKTGLYTLANNQNYYAAFAMDDIRVSKRLTINLGLRWDMETPLTERHDKIAGWDADTASPYHINAGWDWNTALSQAGLSAAQIASIPVPSWAKNGKFPNGAIFVGGTPEHPGRSTTGYHPLQLAPRLGLAYQINPKTVLRASWGMMYISRTGDYWESWLAASDSVNIPWPDPAANGNVGHPIENSFYHPGQIIHFDRSTKNANYTNNFQQTYFDMNRHMPFEQNWSFGFQRQFPWQLVGEVTYNGNHSGNLLTQWNLTPFPSSLIQQQYGSLFRTMISNPVDGQVQAVNNASNPTVPLGYLMLSDPVFGGVSPKGQNRGRTNYNAVNLRLEKRLSHGVAMLFNYTWSKSLDNVGSVDGQGIKKSQGWMTPDDLYGYSPLDETHRFAFYHDVQFPVGKGRWLLGHPTGLASKILNTVVGGWEYAGIAIYRSGRPLSFVSQDPSTLADNGVGTLWGSILGDMGAITPGSYKSDSQLLAGFLDDPTKMAAMRFDPAKFTFPQDTTIGNTPPIYPWIRQPSNISYDASLMKNVPLFGEGRYVQFRVEAENVLNQRGLGVYNTTYGDPYFGLITTAGHTPRNMQISARLVF
jgi:hypothetical protein